MHYSILNSATHANIPQNREGSFIVAFHKERVKNFLDFMFPQQIQLTNTIVYFIDHRRNKMHQIY